MKNNSTYSICFLIYCLIIASCSPSKMSTKETMNVNNQTKEDYAIVLHGGAGTILKKNMTDEKEAAITKVLNDALNIGEAILKKGGSSMDAVEQVIMHLENSPYFNAGKGAVFNNAGENEMDASFMEGVTQNGGAVGGVRVIKNPITAARAVMEHSDHVMLTGKGAEQFAKEQGLDLVDPKYFHTDRRWKSLQNAKAKEEGSGAVFPEDSNWKFGTVGCAALDQNGNIAAGTSTGGMTNKRYNRIGDSPIIGAGTYANNATCAISCTGHGEFFIRYAVAYDISALMEYKGMSLDAAANYVVNKKLVEKGGSGGVIGLDAQGNVTMPFNTAGMYRGFLKANGERGVFIFGK